MEKISTGGKISGARSACTVAVVCLNEEKNILPCLESILAQTCSPKEILVIDNGSTDETMGLVRKIRKKDRRIRLLENLRSGISGSRNLAVRETKTPYLVFTDADCTVPENWLDSLLRGYVSVKRQVPDLAAVGGSNRPPKTDFWFRLLGMFLDSYPGTGSSVQGRKFETPRVVPHLPCVNILLDVDAVRTVGGFDESLGSIIEDEDLTYRLGKNGYRLWYLPDCGVTHLMANGMLVWIRKMILYGEGRIRFDLRHPETIGLKTGMPILVLALWILPVFVSWTIPLLGSYLVVLSGFALETAFRHQKPVYAVPLVCLYAATHVCYALGELKEIVSAAAGSGTRGRTNR